MTIEWVHHDCRNGEYGLTVIANSKQFFFTYADLEIALFSRGIDLGYDMTGFRQLFDDTRTLIYKLREIAGWDKNLLAVREQILLNLYTICRVCTEDGREYEKRHVKDIDRYEGGDK